MNVEAKTAIRSADTPIRYHLPKTWTGYDFAQIHQHLVEAKAAVKSLISAPFQREWVERLQQVQLKMEVAGTSRIEGAEFSDPELEAALDPRADAVQLETHSQRQAHAAVTTYRWLADLAIDRPVDASLLKEIHARIVKDCDDDHCAPGRLRERDHNVTFGAPRHRGCEGGTDCETAFNQLAHAVAREFPDHDPLLQALALHFHLAAMHPFGDGNGRTARAAEALMLHRAGLSDTAFIAMSNYYYENKTEYLMKLAEVRARDFDLSPFLIFGLRGIQSQCEKLFAEIRKNTQKALFRNTMYDLFNRLESKRSRVIKERQIELLKIMLDADQMRLNDFAGASVGLYTRLNNPAKAFNRDIGGLIDLGAISVELRGEWIVRLNLNWHAEITESLFLSASRRCPRVRPSASFAKPVKAFPRVDADHRSGF